MWFSQVLTLHILTNIDIILGICLVIITSAIRELMPASELIDFVLPLGYRAAPFSTVNNWRGDYLRKSEASSADA